MGSGDRRPDAASATAAIASRLSAWLTMIYGARPHAPYRPYSDSGFLSDTETVQYTTTAAGTVYLIVDSYASDEFGPYTLVVTVQ